MAKVIGIGGIFLQFKGETKLVHDWYEQHLGLPMSQYGTGFIEGDQLMLVSFERTASDKMPLLNFRVDDVRTMIEHLKAEGCKILSDVVEYPYGLFAGFEDPFGNYIELWEAYTEEYKRMVQDEIVRYKLTKDDR